MIQTEKHILEFLETYEIIKGHELSKDFKKCFSLSETRGFFDEQSFYLMVHTPEHEVEIYLAPNKTIVELSIKDIASQKSYNVRHDIEWLQENKSNLRLVVSRMLLNLS